MVGKKWSIEDNYRLLFAMIDASGTLPSWSAVKEKMDTEATINAIKKHYKIIRDQYGITNTTEGAESCKGTPGGSTPPTPGSTRAVDTPKKRAVATPRKRKQAMPASADLDGEVNESDLLPDTPSRVTKRSKLAISGGNTPSKANTKASYTKQE